VSALLDDLQLDIVGKWTSSITPVWPSHSFQQECWNPTPCE
jgi:hypothetical protein